MFLSSSFEEAVPTAPTTPATAVSGASTTTTSMSGLVSAIFGSVAGSSAATAHPHVDLNRLGLDQRIFNLLVMNEKTIRDQRNEIMHIRAELSRAQTSLFIMQASRQANLPAAAAQPQLAHGIDQDATIVLPRFRPNIRREETIHAMDIL